MIWRTKTCVILTVWDNFFLELSISCTVWPKKNGLTDAAEEIHEAARFLSFYARFTAFLPLLPLSLRFVCRAGEITLHISGDLRNCLMTPAGQKRTIIKITPKKGIEMCAMQCAVGIIIRYASCLRKSRWHIVELDSSLTTLGSLAKAHFIGLLSLFGEQLKAQRTKMQPYEGIQNSEFGLYFRLKLLNFGLISNML